MILDTLISGNHLDGMTRKRHSSSANDENLISKRTTVSSSSIKVTQRPCWPLRRNTSHQRREAMLACTDIDEKNPSVLREDSRKARRLELRSAVKAINQRWPLMKHCAAATDRKRHITVVNQLCAQKSSTRTAARYSDLHYTRNFQRLPHLPHCSLDVQFR